MFNSTDHWTIRISGAALAVLLLFGAAATPASADERHDRGRQDDRGRDDRRDGDYRHVGPPGERVRALPHHYTRTWVNRRPYYYYGGLFYRPYYQNFVVVGAPIGARIGWLPPGYVSFGLAGGRYAYFNATYYLWDEPRREYVVVEKPSGADEALAKSPGFHESAADMYVYPARGQSEDLTRRDRYECHLWAVDQTRFDPSMGDADASQSGDYRRAITACLEGRGYTVK